MCRLLAYVGAETPVGPLLFTGEHSLERQAWAPKELLSGSVNADGYGVVWYDQGKPARLAEPRPIWYDQELASTLGQLRAGTVVAALRNSTPGLAVDRAGLLPMVLGRYAFALNGFVPDFRHAHMRGLRELLPDDLYAELRGSTDSETLFLLTLQDLRSGQSPVEALTSTARRVYDRVGPIEAQLNMVLSDGEQVTAIRSSSVDATNSLYLAARPSFARGGVVLASEPTHPSEEGWTAVAPHSSVEIGAEGHVVQQPLDFG